MGQSSRRAGILCQATPAAPLAPKNHRHGQELPKGGWDPFSQENLQAGSGAASAWDVLDAAISTPCSHAGVSRPLQQHRLQGGSWLPSGHGTPTFGWLRVGARGTQTCRTKGVWGRMAHHTPPNSTYIHTRACTIAHVHTCMHTHMHVHTHAHKHPCTCIQARMCMYAQGHTHPRTLMHAHTGTDTHLRMFMCVHAHTGARTGAHICACSCIHTHARGHIHTHVCTHAFPTHRRTQTHKCVHTHAHTQGPKHPPPHTHIYAH